MTFCPTSMTWLLFKIPPSSDRVSSADKVSCLLCVCRSTYGFMTILCMPTWFNSLLLLPQLASLAITACGLSATPKSGPPPLPPYTPAPYHHRAPPASPGPVYGVTPAPYPAYGYSPAAPAYHQQPRHLSAHPHAAKDHYGPPACSKNTTKSWCLVDYEYPTYDVQHAIEYHYAAVAALYKDVIANTDNSVDRLKHPSDETYLCPSDTAYVMPLRAVNTQGKWRVIVNQVKAHYETLSQTVRVEECTAAGQKCPLVPECYETKCLQKSVYHRFLVYDPKDYYFPFSIESFKLPAACACYNGAFTEHHK